MTALLLLLALSVQDTVVLKPVVVTATRVPVPADAVTAAVTVIKGETLRERGIRTVAEALRRLDMHGDKVFGLILNKVAVDHVSDDTFRGYGS